MPYRLAHLCLIVAVPLVMAGCQNRTPVADSTTSESESVKTIELDLRSQARAIVNEPEYSGSPFYALLVFGDDAEHQSWLVVDGETVYLDRNANGNLTEPNEKIPLDAEATAKINVAADGEYNGFNVFNLGNIAGHDFVFHVWVLNEDFTPDPNENEIITQYRRERIENGWANSSLYRKGTRGGAQIPVLLCPRPQHAQISHIDGPLTFELKWGDRQKLERDKENTFDVHVGTQGNATLNSRYPVFSNLATEEVPSNVHPVAVFEFPNRELGKGPVKLSVNLDRRC